MNKERVMAAYEALEEHVEPSDAVDHCCAELALAAADAVMFSEGRVAELTGVLTEAYGQWQDDEETTLPLFASLAEAVIAALEETK